MTRFLYAGLYFVVPLSVQAQPKQKAKPAAERCITQAKETALKILKLHSNNDDRATVAETVTAKPGINSPTKVKLEVVEVPGFVYKAEYRLRVLFLQEPQSCTVMGFELVDLSVP